MQLHEEPSSENNLSTSQHRIRPEELTRALAAIEARKQEAARKQAEEEKYLAETIPVEEAVRDLHLEATPEEIWAEVEAQRNAAAETQEEPPDFEESVPQYANRQIPDYVTDTEIFNKSAHREPKIIQGLLGGAAVLGILAWATSSVQRPAATYQPPQPPLAFSNASPHQTVISTTSTQPAMHLLDAEFYRKLALSQGPHATYHATRIQLMMEARAGETLYPDQGIPDGYSVYTTPFAANPMPGQTAIAFRAASESKVDLTVMAGPNRPSTPVYVTTRYAGCEYLRGWITKAEIPSIQKGYSATIYTSRSIAPHPEQVVPITVSKIAPMRGSLIPIDVGQEYPSGYHAPVVVADDVKLDSHAWENYPEMTFVRYIPPAWIRQGAVFLEKPDPHFPLPLYSEFDTNSQVMPVAQVADDRPFCCGYDIIQDIFYRFPANRPLTEVLVDVRPDLKRPFHLIKHERIVYFRGWISAGLTPQQLEQSPLTVYNNADNPALNGKPRQITVSIDNNQGSVTSSSLTIVGVHLDKYAWEKWQP